MISQPVIVYRNRTTIVTVNLGMDVSGDTFASEIRVAKDPSSTLVATWAITFETDGTDGLIRLTMDDANVSAISRDNAFMDLKRTSGGEPYAVFKEALPVVFEGAVTA